MSGKSPSPKEPDALEAKPSAAGDEVGAAVGDATSRAASQPNGSTGDDAGAAATEPGDAATEAATTDGSPDAPSKPPTRIEEPAKVIRIGSMLRKLLEQSREDPVDRLARHDLAQAIDSALDLIAAALSADLAEELRGFFPRTTPQGDATTSSLSDTVQAISTGIATSNGDTYLDADTPSSAQLQLRLAGIVGWLEGLLQGISGTVLAQGGAVGQKGAPAPPSLLLVPTPAPGKSQSGADSGDQRGTPGQYL